MAKSSGLGNRYLIGGYNVSGGINSLERIGGGLKEVLPFTDITQEAMARDGGVRDGGIKFKSYFDDAAGAVHAALKGLPYTDVIGTWSHRATIGSVAASINAKQNNYNLDRRDNGELLFDTELLANTYGLEFGNLLTAITRTDAAATNGAGVDFIASTAFGLQAYLQVVAFTGTDVTVKIQESSDNGGGDPFADVVGGSFAQITGGVPRAERIQTARALTVERYLRAVTVTAGGFSNLEFVVMVVKNSTSVVF